MKILVTGGTGFTGKALVRRLIDDGHEVIALDYKEGLKTDELREWGATVVIGSVTDRDVLQRCMPGVDVVQHVAAAFREMNVDDAYYRKVNVEGTRNVLEIALANGVKKVIYFSTCGVHGNVDHPPAAEDAPIQPADYYQRTKYEAEPIVREFVHKGLKCLIIRPAAIYGPGDPERFWMIFKRVAGGTFPIFGSGKTLYHPLYIDNLVDASILAMQSERGDGEAYLIADEEYVEIETLVREIAHVLNVDLKVPHFPVMPLVVTGHILEKVCKPFGIVPPIFPRRVDWYRQNRAFDISKAKRDLGYNPQVPLREGLRRTAAWYKENGYL
ncbi:MAG: NAD-dependent epimerase/dehydratase family protein [Woeseiaceae bacterium]